MNDFFARLSLCKAIRKRQAKWVLLDLLWRWRIERGSGRLPGTGLRVPFYGRQAPTADVAKIEAPFCCTTRNWTPESTRAGLLTRRVESQ